MRVTDPQDGVPRPCQDTEEALAFNQTGPQGATGATGARGATGAVGKPGKRGTPGTLHLTGRPASSTELLRRILTRLDAMETKQQDIWKTVHYNKGYLQGLRDALVARIHKTCQVVDETRGFVVGFHPYAHVYDCP